MKFHEKFLQKILPHLQSLRIQLISFYIIVSVLVLAVDLVVSYTSIMSLSKGKNEKFLLQQFSQSDYNISNVVNEVDRLSKLFIDNTDVQSFLQENMADSVFQEDENYNSIISRMDDFITNYNYINSIYLFTENGKEVGSNTENTYLMRENLRKNPFFSSELYKNAQKSFPKIALGDCATEAYYNPSSLQGDRYIISIARAVKPIMEPQKTATLVMNVRESYITSIYQSNFTSNDQMYIIDRAGNIISDNKGWKLGLKSPAYTKGNFTKRYGSFVTNIGKQPTQVVYFRLKSSQWYLIDELPLNDVYQDISNIQSIFIFVFVLSTLLFFASYFWLKRITKPLEDLSEKISDVGSGRLGVTLNHIPNNEIGLLINQFNKMSLNIDSLVKRNEQMQEERINLELENLQAQINPHFIYNTLNMIKWMATMSNAKNIEQCLISLGNLLLPIFRDKNRMWPIQIELFYLQNYLDIMNWRYGNTLTYEFAVPTDIDQTMIPKFTLQPIIENSISYGLQNCPKINITVRAYREGDELFIVVHDDGNGMDQAFVNALNYSFCKSEKIIRENHTESVGLYNINRRIKLKFGERYGLRIESVQGSETSVFIHLPVFLQ